MQSRVYKNNKICIFNSHDFVLFKKMYYLCIEFQKRLQNKQKILN